MSASVHREAAFEAAVEMQLLSHGWLRSAPSQFDCDLLLDPTELLLFLEATQPEQLARLAQVAGGPETARKGLIARISKEVETRGTLSVLRRGVKDRGVQFQLAYFKPAHGLTPALAARYDANRCTVVRQLIYSTRHTNELDLALFVNGLLVATAELKNPLTGQTVEDAKAQYRLERDPLDKALSRCALVHFAVDPDLVFVTTELERDRTVFLPFNRGDGEGGAGNASHSSGYSTAYLWEEVWQRDAWLEILQRFLHYDGATNASRGRLLFPRYHQWDAVRRIREDARTRGPGHEYLVQHSAGSGKSNTIAWLAHQLASLYHDETKVFGKVVVITDRRVLDQQLQDTVFQFEHTPGFVECIDKHSAQLASALKNPGVQVIVTTLQKFPFVLGEAAKLPDSSYAVIVDEAHSSQTGETARDLKAALGVGTRVAGHDVADSAASVEGDDGDVDAQDFVIEAIRARGRQPNLSFFAFTATPKQRTLQLFGQESAEGTLEPFHVYSMRQAIEEGFILDVLRNYTTYKTYWRLAKHASDDPDLDRAKAARALARFVSLHPHNLAQKAEVIVEHFRRSTQRKIEGRAKAMVVTRSRLHAVRYKEAVDRYIAENDYGDLKTLVAFSGKVVDELGVAYTEPSMNDGLPEGKLPERFASDDYQLLIVAEKYQTGYDEPLLHTMYVDKKLEGVKAVQTLSRLNRTHPAKDDTFVLDFANDAEAIQKSFAPFYETTIAEPTDPNAIYDVQAEVESFAVIDQASVDAFVERLAGGADETVAHGALYKLLEPAQERFRSLAADRQEAFRSALSSYVRLYAFLAQVVPFADDDLEKLYLYSRFLLLRLRPDQQPGLDLSADVVLTHLRTELQATQDVSLTGGGRLRGFTGEMPRSDPQESRLSEIIEILNDRFGTAFTGADRVYFDQLVEATVEDDELRQQAEVNDLENWSFAFRRKFDHIVVDRRHANEELFKKFLADPAFAEAITEWVMQQSYERFSEESDSRRA